MVLCFPILLLNSGVGNRAPISNVEVNHIDSAGCAGFTHFTHLAVHENSNKKLMFFDIPRSQSETKLPFFEMELREENVGVAYSRYIFPKFLESLATCC